MKSKKRTILFGAGAESVFGLATGEEFALKTAGIKTPEMNNAIEEYCKSLKYDKSFYPDYYSKPIDKDALKKAAAKKQFLSENLAFSTKNEFIAKVNNQKNRVNLNKYSSFFGILDERFHTIIKPKSLGPHNFWETVNCYFRAYLLLASQIIYKDKNSITKNQYFEILNNPKKAYSLMNDVANTIKDRNYYSIIKRFKNIDVVTTNYTPYSSVISGKDVAYIHGNFKLFESAKSLSIFDIELDNFELLKNDVLFPFISIQSGVKPIICESQIKEYFKMIKSMDESEEIMIVGYRLNYDDNHINSFLRSQITKGKKLTVFSFNKNIKNQEILNRLDLNKQYKKQIQLIETNNNNCFDLFEDYIRRY